MPVTVAVPTRGRTADLGRCLRSILTALDVLADPGSELVVVVNGPDARAVDIRLHDPRLRVVTEETPGAARARNIALEVATTDEVLFTDDDCVVPAAWCAELSAGLRTAAAIAAPVVVPSLGPVTCFLDYKRVFTAPPVDRSTVRYFVTANCGLRRSCLPPHARFDDGLFNNAAEDAALSYRLGDAQIALRWAGQASPVEHELAESPDEIVERFLRYGQGNARLVNADGRWIESVPGALEWFLSIRNGQCGDYRRFPEVVDPHLRACFVALDLVQTGCWLIGYLEEMQRHLDVEVLWVDRARLASGLSDVVAELTATVPVSSWVDPVDDMARMATVAATVPDPVCPRIAGALADAAAVRGRRADQRTLTRHLAVFGDEVRHEQERIRAAALTAWNELPTGRAVGLATVEGRLRRVGVSLPDGLHEVEKACATRRRGHNEEQVL